MPTPRRRSCEHAIILGLLALGACQPAPPSEAASSPNELSGAWSLVAVDPGGGAPVIAPSQPGLYIFTDTHYSGVFAPGPEPRVGSAVSFQPTEEEIIAQYQTIIVNTGTYEVDGSTITFRPMLAKSPEFVGGHQTSTFRIQSDTLVLSEQATLASDGSSPPQAGGTLTLVRVE